MIGDINKLCSREDIDWDYIKRNPTGIKGKSWPMKILSFNPSLTWRIVIDNPTGFGDNWDMRGVSSLKDIDWDYVAAHRGVNGIKWDMDYLSSNISLTWAFVLRFINGLHNKMFSTFHLSGNKCLSLEYVAANPVGPDGKPWDNTELAANPSLTEDFLRANETLHGQEWEYDVLAKNKSIPAGYIMMLTDGCIEELSISRSMEEIADYEDEIRWNYHIMSYNENLTWDFVLERIDREWDPIGLSRL
jgi:hypothetical protein